MQAIDTASTLIRMTLTLILLIAFALASVAWTAQRSAAEAAIEHGRRACAAASVQWLDQSVHLVAMRVRRGPGGRLGWERHYSFDYSRDGQDRHRGRIVMQGTLLRELAGPAPAESAAPH